MQEGGRMNKKITEEMLKGKKCSCGAEQCCPNCSFYDKDGKLYPVCHDCGEMDNYGSAEDE